MAWGLMCGLEALLTFIWQIVVWMIRRCYLQRMRSCQQCLHTCFFLSHVYQMTEGRLCQVQLLDDRKLELLVQPKLLSHELLDLVSSHFNLKEKEYFGFTYVDDTGQCKWLQLDRRVLEHDFSKKSGPIALQFLVRFYIETISLLKEHTTVELFFLNAKSAIYNGDIEVESELVFKLAAHALQCICVDFSDENTRADLKKLPALPTKVLKEHPSLLFQWKQLENLYFREKKFAVEVNDPHRRTVTKRTFGQTGLVIHTWYASHSLIKTIWVMAISQHQFYLNRKQSKAKITKARILGDIAADLTENGASKMNKLSAGVKNQLIMASNGSLVSTGSADSEMNDDQKKEKLAELRKREREIQDILSQKLTELKEICLREAELTGKLPKEYPHIKGETPPHVRRRVGTAFKLDDLFPYNEDPYLRNLESRFALQQKIVEAAKKLAAEPDISKLVRKKRRRNCLDAMQKLQEIEDEMNQYRLKKGQKPTQRASVIIAGMSDRCLLKWLIAGQGQPPPLDISLSSKVFFCLSEFRLDHEVQGPGHYYIPREVFSAQSSPCKTLPRMPKDPRSLPQTPVMPRNAYSNSQLGSEGHIRGFRHRSGSLESQSQVLHSHCANKSAFPLSPSRRSNSTEVLDDCSSYTSMSSMDYCLPCSATPPYRVLDSQSHDYRLHRKVEIYGNTGSMPNLVPQSSSCYGYQQNHYGPTAYCVTGYPGFEYEPCSNGAYVYESELEGHYNINPTYPAHGYQSRSRNRHYGIEGSDNLSQNPYATVRPPRGRQGPLNEVLTKNMYKALVAEHLKGWYNRSAGHRDPGTYQLVYTYKYDRGSQHSLGYQTLPAPFSHSSRTNSFSSAIVWPGINHSSLAEIMFLIDLDQFSQTQSLEGHSSEQFCSNPNQTHLIQLIKVFMITRDLQTGVSWSWLELNSAELWPSRNRV
uniref:FERM domain containing 4Bb n=1 Tax=Cyprinus carpio TaxID=7962 RepID=A0A8C1GK79_CYPCA